MKNTSTITTIQNGAFANSGLESISIPSSVTEIGSSAFFKCKSLTTIEINSSGDTLVFGPDVFQESGLKSITIPDRFDGNIKNGMFYRCLSLTNVEFKGTIYSIGKQAFDNCTNLVSILFDNGIGNISSIGDYTFRKCGVLSLDLSALPSTCSIGTGAFESATGIIRP